MAGFRVLLVEDSKPEAELIVDLMTAHQPQVDVLHVTDGLDALDALGIRPGQAQTFRPDLILLDLNLRRMPGREVLTEIKATEALRRIPVVVLTSSDAESDLLACLGEGANCYVHKPVGLGPFREAIQSIAHFWVETAHLASQSGAASGR